MTNEEILDLAYKYVKAVSKSKNYNLQAIANTNFINNYKKEDILNDLRLNVKKFCKYNKHDSVRDFVYKNDYFTPRKMYLISPICYLYYTYLVFRIAHIFIMDKDILDFSIKNVDVFYSGKLVFEDKYIYQNSKFNESYSDFKERCSSFIGRPALKIDISNFFDSIKIKNLIDKLRRIINNSEIINDLEYFFNFLRIDSLPQYHYSLASSILSQFYLIDFTNSLNESCEENNLYCIRFVDDMYIIHLEDSEDYNKKNNMLLNEFSYFLWKDSLALNFNKTKMLTSEEFKKENDFIDFSYFEPYSIEKIVNLKIREIINNKLLTKFIRALNRLEKDKGLDLAEYKKLVNKYISIEGDNSNKVINSLIYSKWKRIPLEDMHFIINNWRFILFNPSQFTILYISIYRHLEKLKEIDNSGGKIKKILSFLFSDKTFTIRDSLVAITYLIQSKFRHKDLMNKIGEINNEYSAYVNKYLK